MRMTCTGRGKIILLQDVMIRKQFEGKVIELVDFGAPNLCGRFKDGVFEACDEMCGRRGGEEAQEIIGGGMKR